MHGHRIQLSCYSPLGVYSNLSSSIFITLPPPYFSGVTGSQWVPGSVKVRPGHCQQRHVGTHISCPLPRDKGQGHRLIAMWNLAPHLSDRQSRLVIGQLWVHWCCGQTPVCRPHGDGLLVAGLFFTDYPPSWEKIPLLRTRGYVILWENRGGSVGSTFDSGPMCCRFESHLWN